MRLGIITDVHSNTEGLAAVVQRLAAENVDAIFHLGDVVGYGAEPDQACDLVRAECQMSLLGNHDAAVVGQMDVRWFANHARAAVDWTLDNISTDHLEWLRKSPLTHREGPYLFCHGSPIAPAEYRYVLSQFEADEIFAWLKHNERGLRVVFVGHAHQCIAFSDTGAGYRVIDGIREHELDLSSGRWVVNVGSAGQPRDGDPRACYAVLDTDNGHYKAGRVKYDCAATGAKIMAAGLPEILALRLALGR